MQNSLHGRISVPAGATFGTKMLSEVLGFCSLFCFSFAFFFSSKEKLKAVMSPGGGLSMDVAYGG